MTKQPSIGEILAGLAALVTAIAAGFSGNSNSGGSNAPPSITNQNTNNLVIPAAVLPPSAAEVVTPEDILGKALKSYALSVNPSAKIDVTNEGVTVVTGRFIAKVLPEDIRALRITDSEAFLERLSVAQDIQDACAQLVPDEEEFVRCINEKLTPAQNRLLSAMQVISAT